MILLVLLLCNVFVYQAEGDQMCQCLQPPLKSLKQLDGQCSQVQKARSVHCTNAAYQYCKQTRFPWFHPGENVPEMMGNIQMANNNRQTELACIKTKFHKKVNMKILGSFERGCNLETSQSVECLEAVSELCQDRFGREYAGMPQSSPTNEEPRQMQVACFKSVLKEQVPIDELKKHHKQCNDILKSANQECFTAASMWCKEKKHSGGITQETTDTEIGVACYDALFVSQVPITGPVRRQQQRGQSNNDCNQPKKKGRRQRKGKQKGKQRPQKKGKKAKNQQQTKRQQQARRRQQQQARRRQQQQRMAQQKKQQQAGKSSTNAGGGGAKSKSSFIVNQLIEALKGLGKL